MAPASGTHYHQADYPDTLRLVAEVVQPRVTRGQVVGYQRTTEGVWIHWIDLITCNGFSSTEVGVLLVAQGLSILEDHGGCGPLGPSVLRAIGAVL